MGHLLLKEDLRKKGADTEAAKLARARTLTVLERLVPSRKEAVMRFLFEAELIQPEAGTTVAIISLRLADLSGTRLLGIYLNYADLSGANLTDADVTQEQPEQAKSLEGATMADGQDEENNGPS